VFSASDQAGFITGTTLLVDGGMTAGYLQREWDSRDHEDARPRGCIRTAVAPPPDIAEERAGSAALTGRAALGENTETLAGFRAFLADWSPTAGTHDERWLDARRQVGLLLASAGHYEEAVTSPQDLRRDLIAKYGESSGEVAEVAALLARIARHVSSAS